MRQENLLVGRIANPSHFVCNDRLDAADRRTGEWRKQQPGRRGRPGCWLFE